MNLARIATWILPISFPISAAAQTWQLDYDASRGTLPSAQGWTHIVSDPPPDDGLDEGNYLVALGALTQGPTGGASDQAANSQFYSIPTPRVNFDDDVIVIDARLKILTSTITPSGGALPRAGFGISLTDKDGEQVILYLGTSRLYLRAGSAVASDEGIFDSTADFADYRIRIDRNGMSVRANGSLVETLDRGDAWHANFPTADRVLFGDISDGHSSSSQLQHIRISRFAPATAEVRDYRVVAALSAFDSSAQKNLSVSCPPGTKILSGGVTTIGAEGSVGISDSLPGPIGSLSTSWYGAARELVTTSANWQIRVDAICGEISGHEVGLSDSGLSTEPNQSGEQSCPDGKIAFSGGAGILGADLRQALIRNRALGGGPGNPAEWTAAARDNGAGATSAAPWGLRTARICTDAAHFELVSASSNLDAGSPKQAAVNCPGGKVPIAGGASITGDEGLDAALRISQPKEGGPGEPFVGWFAEAQADSDNWSLGVSVLCAPLADPTVSKNGLIGRWAGEFDATDSWGIRHGSLENGVGFDPAVFGQGFRFDPPLPEVEAKPWVRIPNTPAPGPSSVFPQPGATEATRMDLYPDGSSTADAWIVTDTFDPDDFSTVLALRDLAGTEPNPNCSLWQVLLTSEGFPFANARSAQPLCSAASVTAGPSIADGRPHHLALRRDVESGLRRLSLWVDGVRVSETSLTLMLNEGPLFPSTTLGDPLSIGASRMDGSTGLFRPFNGLIDDVKYYDRALTDEEIREIAGCGVPLALPRVINLDAARFGQPSIGPEGLCVFLEEGRYRLTLVNPSVTSTARFTAWSPSPAHPWMTLYSVRGEVDPGLLGGFPTASATPQEAFDATQTREVTLSLNADQRVYFSLINELALDNRGGVSIRIEVAPPDGDGDGAEDDDDNCPLVPNAAQSDVDQNGIGDECECGDQNGDGTVSVLDLLAINLAIFTPSLATPLCDTNEDGLCNVLDIIGANLKIFGQPAYCSRYPSP